MTFPRNKAKKSPLQQHAESYNPIDSILADKNGPDHLCIADSFHTYDIAYSYLPISCLQADELYYTDGRE